MFDSTQNMLLLRKNAVFELSSDKTQIKKHTSTTFISFMHRPFSRYMFAEHDWLFVNGWAENKAYW